MNWDLSLHIFAQNNVNIHIWNISQIFISFVSIESSFVMFKVVLRTIKIWQQSSLHHKGWAWMWQNYLVILSCDFPVSSWAAIPWYGRVWQQFSWICKSPNHMLYLSGGNAFLKCLLKYQFSAFLSSLITTLHKVQGCCRNWGILG